MTTTAEALERGRTSYRRQAWGDAYERLSSVDHGDTLGADDLERLATAAHLSGRDAESIELMTRAHNALMRESETVRAARCAFWVGFELVHNGEMARASGWFARAHRLLDEAGMDCVERGYLLVPAGLQLVNAGDFAAAHATFGQAVEIGERFHDLDLVAIARHGQGRALIRLGETANGVALLDEAMVSVTSGEVSPIIAGIVYCSVIEACTEIFDLRRAREWTTALTDWCESQQGLVAYRGQCMLHRAQVMQSHGAWQDAMDEARRACEQLSRPPGDPATGAAFYQQAELHRLRGEFALAEGEYRQASQWGHMPEPGLAMLRLAQGQTDAAEAAIRRVLDEAGDRIGRSKLLSAYCEIMLAVNDLDSARSAAAELSETADHFAAPLLRAEAGYSLGAVSLAEGGARAALEPLRRAAASFRQLDSPYSLARVRALIGRCCRALGDNGSAEMEFDAARATFLRLNAEPDIALIDELSQSPSARPGALLTGRELEVLRLVASGKTNRAIAADLVISEKTVARHISNIFTKLNISSRSAATAYAYEHNLL